MENAAKALLIAAGIFLILLIISLLVFTYGRISSYYEQKHELTVMEQSLEFNAKFENYHRDNIRGSELISLMNRVIDYNANEAYFKGTDNVRIRVTITLGETEILNQFKYETNDGTSRNKYLTPIITNTNGSGTNWQNDKALTSITNTSMYLIQKANDDFGISNMNDTKLQQLASQISNIIVDENDEKSSMVAFNRFKRADLLEDILGITVGSSNDCDVVIDKTTGKTKNTNGKNIINSIREITSEYYQYMQFKRACFECTEIEYDANTNRVVKMNFKVQTKDNGTVIFD